jgi:1,4-alpha-glucan branching enzyme
LNSDSENYGGEDFGNLGGVAADEVPMHGRPYSINVIVPPLGVVFLKSEQ